MVGDRDRFRSSCLLCTYVFCCLMLLNILDMFWGVTPSPLFSGFVLKATAGSVCLSSIFKLTVLLNVHDRVFLIS